MPVRTAVLVVSYLLHHFLHVQTAYSPADLADLRRQKTGWVNGSAKADDADSAEKDC